MPEIYICGAKKVVSDEQKQRYYKLVEELNKLSNSRTADQVPPDDPYYKKKEELDKFVNFL